MHFVFHEGVLMARQTDAPGFTMDCISCHAGNYRSFSSVGRQAERLQCRSVTRGRGAGGENPLKKISFPLEKCARHRLKLLDRV